MIEFMQQGSANILGVRASGRLTAADYRGKLVPRMESLIKQHGKLRVLFFMDDSFDGWDLRAAWENTLLDIRHRSDFEKVAMVGASRPEGWCIKLASLVIKGNLRVFPRNQLAEAWEWIGAEMIPPTMARSSPRQRKGPPRERYNFSRRSRGFKSDL